VRYTDDYDVETDEGMARRRPMDVLIGTARLVPREHWRTCPQCKQAAPLFFGDPDGAHWCDACQVVREHPELASTTDRAGAPAEGTDAD
jgi:hypothetical protein